MSYETQVKDAKKKDVRIEIETSDNGGAIVYCSWSEDKPKGSECECGHGCSPMSDYKRKKYVYDSLEEALRDIPGMISMKQDVDDKDPIDKKIMDEED